MPDLPSTLSAVRKLPQARLAPPRRRCTRLTLFGCAGLLLAGCLDGTRGPAAREASRYYPPPPQTAHVIALGALRGTPPPSQAEVDLSLFLFGAEPSPNLAIANPGGLAVRGQSILVCDNALSTVLRWEPGGTALQIEPFDPPPLHPFAIDIAANGDLLVCDREGVKRVDTRGKVVRSYALPAGDLKPGGILAVGDTVWVTNLAAQQIEVFDGASGAFLRSIGAPGQGPAHFGLPRGLARTPDGHVCVVDMLENRVQVLDAEGQWVRNIGQPGDAVGCFGRAESVAVGPDGTVFVTDDFSQRVHAFAPGGQPLLAFGEPGSGPGALALPSGITISTSAPQTDLALPEGTSPAYYVLVSEQLDRPGVRVYAWLPGTEGGAAPPLPVDAARAWQPRFPGSVAINPHWSPERCAKCHQAQDERLLPIAPEAVNALCLSCHDGVQAPADPHPIGRPAVTDLVTTPADWPTVNGTIGCLTCHDIQRHCNVTAERPAVNSVLLHSWDPQRPLEYCGNCHRTDVGGRFSPHRQRDATGKIREDACLFCHTHKPDIPADGQRRFQPHLRVETSDLCLNCHTKHWDLSPRGHVDRPVTPATRQWLLMRQLSTEVQATPEELARLAGDPQRRPALLPLGHEGLAGEPRTSRAKELVTCYTCHNPHYAGMFPPDSVVGALATNSDDRRAALRLNWIDLCSECHHR